MHLFPMAAAVLDEDHLAAVRFHAATAQGDAQFHKFAEHYFNIAISRYGTMFFADPIAAFRNIGSALCPGGRLVMMVWRAHEENQWSVVVHEALAPYSQCPQAYEHFSLAEPRSVERQLSMAGFTHVKFVDVYEPVYYGEHIDVAVNWVRGFRFVRTILERLDVSTQARVLENLRVALASHLAANGVWLNASERIVLAEHL